MAEDCSAYPDRLMNYSNRSKPNNSDLESVGNDAGRKLVAFLDSNPDPKVLPQLRNVAQELVAYATKKQGIDQWVFDVGLAFLTVSEKKVPAGPSSYYQSGSLGTQLSTTSATALNEALTNNALTQQAKSNASKLNDLLKYANPETLRANQAQIEQLLKYLDFYKDDPIQAAAFFKELGPANTLTLVHAIQFLRLGDAQMTQLSQTLATATQSDTFDPNFAVNLVHASLQPDQGFTTTNQRDHLGTLLKAGMFSTDFLTKLGDEYLYRQGGHGALSLDYGDPVVSPFFNALARNPEAAYSYLTGPSPLPNMPKWVVMGRGGNPTGTSRIAQLETFLSTWSMGGQQYPQGDWQNALNQATLAADRQASDIGDPAQVVTLLKDISDGDWTMIGNGFRPVATQLVSEHLDLFFDHGTGTQPLSWDQRIRLLALAETQPGGAADKGRMNQIQDATAQYMQYHVGNVVDLNNGAALNDWLSTFGTLGALWQIGPLMGAYLQQKNTADQHALIGNLITWTGIVLVPFFPIAGEGGAIAAKLGLDAAGVTTLNRLLGVAYAGGWQKGNDLAMGLVNGNPSATVLDDPQVHAKSEVQSLALIMLYAKDPGMLPVPPDDPRARQFLGDMIVSANATGTSSQQLQDEYRRLFGKDLSNNDPIFAITRDLGDVGNTYQTVLHKGDNAGQQQMGH